jgi:Ino eighty subunit 1
VNLIFVMCNAASKVAELHFPRGHEFHDLIMKTQYSSTSRAKAFLWLMWFYLESDFTEEGCEENPFGPGVDYGLDVANQGVPRLHEMSSDEKEQENVDTVEEKDFGREKQKTRAKILEMDQAYLNERESRRGKIRVPFADDGPAILPRIRPSKHESDMDSTRSTPPPKSIGRAAAAGSGRRAAPLKYQIFEGSSPARGASEGVVARKPRPPTAHQLAVERNRHQRVEYILDRGLRKQHHKCRKARKQAGAISRAYHRIQAQEDPFEDSDDEEVTSRSGTVGRSALFREKGIGGLCLLTTEKDDYGEEVSAYVAALRRSTRRLGRWRGHESELGVIAPIKKRRQNGDAGESEKRVDDDVDNGDVSILKMNGDHMGDMTMDDMDVDGDQTVLDDETRMDDDMDDPDRTEVMGDSDVE